MKKTFILLITLIATNGLFAQLINYQDFENGLEGWQAVSMNTDNNSSFGFNNLQTSAHSGSTYFQFSSYYSASDYNQYLISPNLNLTNEALMSYFCVKTSSNGTESFQIMISTTDNAVSSFTPLGSLINPTSTWTQHTVTLPANTQFVAFHYTSDYQYYMGIDDIFIYNISSTPEITLTGINVPTFVNAEEPFTVSGTILNSSTVVLNRFDVAYTIDGVTTTDSITGLSVASGATYSFNHPVAASISSTGYHPIVVTVENPNGHTDVPTDNTCRDTIKVCGIISNLPYDEGFENGLNCWQAISMNTNNSCGVVTSTSAHSGNRMFRFSSWNSSSNYAQYLISPELSFTQPTGFSFYAKDIYGYEGESIQVMVSTTDDAPASFSNLGEEIYPYGWRQHKRLIPANAKYVAIRYTAQNQYYTGIDDIQFYEVPTAPEIELTRVDAPLMAGNDAPFTLTGNIVNHSSTPITSFEVSYTVADNTVTDTITGVNFLYNDVSTFTIPTSIHITTPGSYTISVTVSDPNGVQDNMTDNTLSVSVEIYESTTAIPRKVLMEHFSTANCPNCYDGHQNIDAAIEGYEDNVIWITHHTGYYSDQLTITSSTSFEVFFNDGGNTYAPAVMLDRTYFGEQEFTHALGTPPGPVFYPYSDLNDGLAAALSIPAHISLEFSDMSYDAATRHLSVTVSGNVVQALDASDPRLNVWLMEDGLIADGSTQPGHGPTQAYAPEGFTHDHVIRELLNTNTWGDGNIIPATAGASYSQTYTLTVPDQYIDSHCYLVAFVSEGNHSNVNNCRVYNAEKSRFLTEQENCSIALTYNDQPLHSGSTIQIATESNEIADAFVGYANVGDTDILFRVKRENIEMVNGAEAQFCIAGICYGGTLSAAIPLAAGASVPASEANNALHASYMAPTDGSSIVKYTFFNVEDTTDAVYFFIHYTPETSIQSLTASTLHCYPNPTTGMVNVQFTMNNKQWENVEIQVFDVYGRLLQTVETCHGASLQTTQIDLSHYATGIYLVRWVNGGKVVAVRKVVKK